MRAQPAGINPFKNFLEDNVQVTKQFYFLFLKILHLKIQKLKAAVLLTSFFWKKKKAYRLFYFLQKRIDHCSLEKKSPNMFTAVLPCDAAVLVPVSVYN